MLDFKSALQELLAREGARVTYEVAREAGPPHDRRFEVAASVDGEVIGRGQGRSKKAAEQAAAAEALERRRAVGSRPEATNQNTVRPDSEPSQARAADSMHLSSITIKGFKSFPERTRLVFSPGVSVIVGPNGCGKSNITDAVLWALGEQSPLAVRGQSMQDMIFAGGEGSRRAATPRSRSSIERPTPTDSAGRGGQRVLRDLDQAPARAQRRGRVPAQRRPLPARRRDRGARRRQPRPRDALGDQPGPGGGDRPLEAARPAPAGRGGRRPRQAPQAPPPGPAEARAHPGQPRPGARRRARGAQPAAAAEAPGPGGRHPGAPRARGRRAARAAAGGRAPRARRASSTAPSATRPRRARRDSASRPSWPRSTAAAARSRSASPSATASGPTVWGRLTALRAAHERLSVRAEALAGRRAELAAELERRRAALGALADELAADRRRGRRSGGRRARADRLGARRRRARPSSAPAPRTSATERATEVARVREAVRARGQRGAGASRTCSAERRQDSLESRIAARDASCSARLDALLEAAGRGARRGRRARRRRSSAGCSTSATSDDVTAQLRACSRAEAELQAKLRAMRRLGDRGRGPGRAPARSPRRGGGGAASGSPAQLGREIGPGRPRRWRRRSASEVERKLERLARRREPLGPGQPARRAGVRRGARAREPARGAARRTSSRRSPSSQGLIRETDRKIQSAFEETLRGDPAELRGADRAPLPGRPRPPAPGRASRARAWSSAARPTRRARWQRPRGARTRSGGAPER